MAMVNLKRLEELAGAAVLGYIFGRVSVIFNGRLSLLLVLYDIKW
jgi:hypothetical protein